MKRLLWALPAVGLMLLGAACGSSRDDNISKQETFPVKGKVYLEGHALAGVSVVFHPVGGAANAPRSYGRTAADGTFTLSTYAANDGAPPGQYAVTILWPDGESPLPKYSSPDTSGIRVEVKAGANEPSFRLRRD